MYAALFPGQGSHRVGMGRALYEASPAAKEVLDRAEAALPGLLKLMWEGPEEALTLTENQQPALLAAGLFGGGRKAPRPRRGPLLRGVDGPRGRGHLGAGRRPKARAP